MLERKIQLHCRCGRNNHILYIKPSRCLAAHPCPMHFLLHGKTQTVAFGMSQNVCIPVPMHAYILLCQNKAKHKLLHVYIHPYICVHTYVSMHFLLHQYITTWHIDIIYINWQLQNKHSAMKSLVMS